MIGQVGAAATAAQSIQVRLHKRCQVQVWKRPVGRAPHRGAVLIRHPIQLLQTHKFKNKTKERKKGIRYLTWADTLEDIENSLTDTAAAVGVSDC